MTENPNIPPVNPPEPPVDSEDHQEAVPPPAQAAPPGVPPEVPPQTSEAPVAEAPAHDADRMGERLERLGGEPAPAITPEEFARLQRAGQVHIDARGRVRTARRSDAEAGVSLRKRRAWYV